MESPKAKALTLFHDHYNCGQAILMAFGPAYGLPPKIAEKLGRPLGSGMGGKGFICGAVSAAVLILGLAQPEKSERHAKKEVYRAVREMMARFEARHGSIQCGNLLGVDLNTRLGPTKMKLSGFYQKKACPSFVLAVAEILEELLSPP
jgi:C_GCAxxG_C_C family probable redox protein